MAFSTDNDIIQYMPDLYDYGIQDYSDEHIKTYNDLVRRLNVQWWPRANYGSTMNVDLLDDTQFTRAAVFYTLAYYILPKLTQFTVDGDRFTEMMKYYKGRFEEEWSMILSEGVRYDADESGTFDTGESEVRVHMRLVR